HPELVGAQSRIEIAAQSALAGEEAQVASRRRDDPRHPVAQNLISGASVLEKPEERELERGREIRDLFHEKRRVLDLTVENGGWSRSPSGDDGERAGSSREPVNGGRDLAGAGAGLAEEHDGETRGRDLAQDLEVIGEGRRQRAQDLGPRRRRRAGAPAAL